MYKRLQKFSISIVLKIQCISSVVVSLFTIESKEMNFFDKKNFYVRINFNRIKLFKNLPSKNLHKFNLIKKKKKKQNTHAVVHKSEVYISENDDRTKYCVPQGDKDKYLHPTFLRRVVGYPYPDVLQKKYR